MNPLTCKYAEHEQEETEETEMFQRSLGHTSADRVSPLSEQPPDLKTRFGFVFMPLFSLLSSVQLNCYGRGPASDSFIWARGIGFLAVGIDEHKNASSLRLRL